MSSNRRLPNLEALNARKAKLDAIMGSRLRDVSAAQMRELLMIIGPLILLVLGALWFASRFIQPAPPKVVAIATGGQAGGYFAFGKRYAESLKRHGITLDVRATAGSIENVRLLDDADPARRVDLALLQGGITNSREKPGLVSLGRLFLEPLWLFYRGGETIDRLHQLKGKRIAIGPEGSGTRHLASALLGSNGVTAETATLLPLSGQQAAEALTSGQVDAVFLVLAPEAPLVQSLIANSSVRLMNFAQGEAYTRRFSYLQRIVLPQGAIDLVRNIPGEDVTLLAPIAALVARENLHPALVGLMVEAIKEVHSGGGMFHRLGDFPRPLDPEFDFSDDAERAFKTGPNWLKRTLPFWLATFVERLVVIAVPLAGVMIPLIKIGPAIYKWRVRRRLLYWYGRLKALESTVGDAASGEVLVAQREEITTIDRAVATIPVPLSFSDQYYSLRAAIDLVRNRLSARDGVAPVPAA